MMTTNRKLRDILAGAREGCVPGEAILPFASPQRLLPGRAIRDLN